MLKDIEKYQLHKRPKTAWEFCKRRFSLGLWPTIGLRKRGTGNLYEMFWVDKMDREHRFTDRPILGLLEARKVRDRLIKNAQIYLISYYATRRRAKLTANAYALLNGEPLIFYCKTNREKPVLRPWGDYRREGAIKKPAG